MYIFITALLIIFAVFLHECGHLRAMHKHGVKVTKLVVGLEIPFLTLHLQFPWLCYGTPVFISPLVLWGYVATEDGAAIEALPLKDQLEIDGAGIIMNLILACFFIVVASHNTLVVVGCFAALPILVVFGREISIFLLPVLSTALFCFMPTLVKDVFKAIPDAGKSTSIEIAGISIHSFQDIWASVAIASLLLALSNLIPLYPLDGGRLVKTCVKNMFPAKLVSVYSILTGVVLGCVALVSIYDLVLAAVRLILKTL